MNKMKSAKTMRKPPPIATVNNQPAVTEDFEIELYWCVQQLENALNSGKLTQKIADDTVKNIKVLKSGTAPLIKKRQVMKAALGDYRGRMKAEEKKMALAPKQVKFTPQQANADKKCNFVKKSAILSSGKDFRFNFQPSADDGAATPAVGTSTIINSTSDGNQSSSSVVNRSLNLTSGAGFKFNFNIDEANENLNFNDLSISNKK